MSASETICSLGQKAVQVLSSKITTAKTSNSSRWSKNTSLQQPNTQVVQVLVGKTRCDMKTVRYEPYTKTVQNISHGAQKGDRKVPAESHWRTANRPDAFNKCLSTKKAHNSSLCKKNVEETLQHRLAERQRHKDINGLIDCLGAKLPQPINLKETKVVTLQRVISYIVFLETKIKRLCGEMKKDPQIYTKHWIGDKLPHLSEDNLLKNIPNLEVDYKPLELLQLYASFICKPAAEGWSLYDHEQVPRIRTQSYSPTSSIAPSIQYMEVTGGDAKLMDGVTFPEVEENSQLGGVLAPPLICNPMLGDQNDNEVDAACVFLLCQETLDDDQLSMFEPTGFKLQSALHHEVTSDMKAENIGLEFEGYLSDAEYLDLDSIA